MCLLCFPIVFPCFPLLSHVFQGLLGLLSKLKQRVATDPTGESDRAKLSRAVRSGELLVLQEARHPVGWHWNNGETMVKHHKLLKKHENWSADSRAKEDWWIGSSWTLNGFSERSPVGLKHKKHQKASKSSMEQCRMQNLPQGKTIPENLGICPYHSEGSPSVVNYS